MYYTLHTHKFIKEVNQTNLLYGFHYQYHVLAGEPVEGVGELLPVLRLVVGRVAPPRRPLQPAAAEQPHGPQERGCHLVLSVTLAGVERVHGNCFRKLKLRLEMREHHLFTSC